MKRITSGASLQIKRAAWILFDLFAQTIDDILEQHLIAVAIPTPNRLDDLFHAEHKARTTHQQMQQSKFEVSQPDFDPVWIDHTSPRWVESVFPGFDQT